MDLKILKINDDGRYSLTYSHAGQLENVIAALMAVKAQLESSLAVALDEVLYRGKKWGECEKSLAEAREEIEKMREYIIEEVGIEHAPSEFGGKA